MKRLTPEQPLHRCLTAFLVVVSLVPSPLLQANPAGEVVIHGDVQFDRSAGQLRVLQASDRAIIDWESFSIDAGQLTEFVQPNSGSAALNRVRGASASQIEGMLRANGKVYLLNPNGILIGPNGSIDVGGFAGSTLDVSDEEFRNGGNLNFAGASQAAIVNLGSISALDGDVILIATSVSNEGTIKAPNGTAALAAGNDVLLAESGSERIFVRGASGGNKAVGVNNSGAIEANIAELKSYGGNIYGMAVRNEGRVAATGVTRQGGQIFLSARGGKVRSTGTLKARKSDGSGGSVKVDSGADARTEIGGKIDASGDSGKGGEIVILGREIEVFEGSLILNDGETGGGNTFVGGGLRGQNPEFMNAENVTVGVGSLTSANAQSSGNGGQVVFFAEGTLEFGGEVSVQGGAVGGDGGFVELSGKKLVRIPSLSRQVHLAAPNGRGGTLLLDPTNVVIKAGTAPLIGGASVDTILYADDISTILGSGNFTIETDSVGIAAGDITVEKDAGISWNSGNSLTLQAHRDITLVGDGTIGATISSTGSGAFSATAARSISFGTNSSVRTTNGNLSLTANAAGTHLDTFDGIDINAGTVQVIGSGNLALNGKGGLGGGADPSGVVVRGGGAVIGGTSGVVSVNGTGGSGTSNDIGFSNLVGVIVDGTNSRITSDGAAVQVTGIGGTSTGAGAGGVLLINGGMISAGGSGSVNVTGTGGNGTRFNPGVDVVHSGSIITSTNGIVTVTGTGGTGALGENWGAFAQLGGVISAGGSNSVNVFGTGGSGAGGNNHGVVVRVDDGGPPGAITSGGGNVNITGTEGTGGIGNLGISVQSGGTITTAANGGNITLVADTMGIANAVAANGSSTVTLRQRTNNVAIHLGSVIDTTAGTLELSDAELDAITAGSLQIGNSNSGAITVSSAISHANNLSMTTGAGMTLANAVTMGANKNLTLLAHGTASGTINLSTTSSDLSASGTGSITLTTARNVSLAAGSSVTTVNGNLTISANQQTTATSGNFIGVDVTNGLIQSTGAGNLTVRGKGGNDISGSQIGVRVSNGSDIIGGTTGSLIVEGTGGTNGGSNNFGVLVDGLGSSIISTIGAVSVTGTGGAGTASQNMGVRVNNSGLISAGGTGAVTVTGNGGGINAGQHHGVQVLDSGKISSSGGNVAVTGTGGTGGSSHGVRINQGEISAVGVGTVTVAGSGGTGGNGNHGVSFLGSSAVIASNDGNVSITATAGGGTSTALDLPAGAINSGNNRAITLTADSMSIAGAINSGSGTTTLETRTAGTLIDLGGNDVISGIPLTLGLTDAELDLITAGTLQIGNTNSGAMTVSDAIFRAAATNLNLTTGGSINFSGSSALLDANGGNVTLNTNTVSGAITSGGGSTDIRANEVTLTAGAGGIGSNSNPLITDATSLSATVGGNGSSFLSEIDTVNVGVLLNYLGSVNLISGTFRITPGGGIDGFSPVFIDSAAVLQLNGTEQFLNSLSGSGSITNASATAGKLNIYNQNSSTFSGVLGGSGTNDNNFSLSTENIGYGPGGTLTLSGANTYTGGTTVNFHTLKLGSASALGSTSSGTTVANGAVLDLNGQSIGAEAVTLNGTGISSGGALINSSGSAASLSGNIALASASSIGGSGNATYSGTVNGGFGLTLVGAGTKTFSGIVGGSTALTGITQDDASGVVGFNDDVSVGSGGATFNANVTLDGLTFTSGGAVSFGNAATDTLTISGGATTVSTTSGNVTLNSTTTGNEDFSLGTTPNPVAGGISISGAVTMAADKNFAASASGLINLSHANADLSTSGTGTISLTTNRNINLSTGSSLVVENGNLTLSANGAGTESGNFSGITVGNGALIRSLGSGGISLTGKGGVDLTADNLRGVEIAGTIRSVSGAIEISGTGGGGTTSLGDNQHGILLESTGLIESVGNGSAAATITLTGVGGSALTGFGGIGSGNQQGISLLGSISSEHGDISLTGTGGAAEGINNKGIQLSGTGSIISTGSSPYAADIVLTGYGSSTYAGDLSDGISLPGGSITSVDGNITLTGRSYIGNNVGIRTGTTGTTTNVAATGSGAITITAVGSPTATLDDFFSQGLPSTFVSSIGSSNGTGGITLNADTVDLAFVTLANAGNLRIGPTGFGVSMGLGGETGTLNLNAAELANLSDGFSSIQLGNESTGQIRIASSTFRDPVSFLGGTNIHVNGQLTGEDEATFTFETVSTSTTYLNANIVTDGNLVSIIDDVVLGANVLIDTTNGNLNTAGANVSVSGTVSGSGSARNLSIISGTGGTIELGGTIGGDNLIGDISLSGGAADLNAMTSQGNIEVYVDAIELGGNISGSGTLKLAPLSSGTTIGIGSAAVGDFYLNTTEISYLQNGFTSITIGSSTSGDIEIEQSEFFDPLEVIGAGNIDIIGELTGNANVTLTADNITVDAPVNSTAGSLIFNLNNQGPSAGGTIAVNANLYYDTGVEFNGGDGTEDLVTYAGFVGPVEFSLNDLSAIEFLIGSGDMDELFGPALGSEYTFTGTDSFSVAGVAVSAFENVTAGADEDTFIFEDGAGLTGTLSGGGPSNQLRFSAFTSAVGIDFENLTASFLGGGFTDINHFVGNGANATFTGQNAATTYTVTGENDFEFGTVPDKVTVTDFANLTGGDGADSFNFKTAGVFTGTLNGGGDSNTIDFATENFGFPASINFETKNGSGFSGGGAFSNIAHFIGQGEGYTFIGQNTAADYTVTGEDDFEFDVYPDTFTVTDFANLTGGTGVDNFAFEDGASLTGSLVGGGTENQLDLSSYASAVAVNFQTGTATGIGGTFSGIDDIVGNGTNATFTGLTLGKIYNISGTNDFTFDSVTVTDFANLTGGSGDDTFIFADAATLTGNLVGGGSANRIDLSAYTTAVGVNFQTSTSTGIGGTFSGIDDFDGNGASSTFTGLTAATTYNVSGANDFTFGSVSVTDFANLTGGANDDTFIFANGASLGGNLVGGGAANRLDLSAYSGSIGVDFENTTATGIGGTFSGIDDFDGNGANSTFTGLAAGTAYSISGANDFSFASVTVTDFAILTGGAGNDTFSFAAGSSLSGTLDGGGGTNSLSYSSYGSPVTVNLGSGAATGTGGFVNVTDFVGSASTDTLRGTAGTDVVDITSNNSGTVNVTNTFASFEILDGGSGNDLFNFLNQATVSLVNGGADFDTLFLDDSNLTGDHTYTITSNSITRNPVYNFINIEHLDLLAGEGDDTINSGFFPFSQSLDSGLGFNTLNLPGVTNLDGNDQIQNVSHLRFAAPRTLTSNPGNGNTPPPPAEFVAQNRFNNGSSDQMMQQLMGNQGGFGATTVIGQGAIIAVEGNSYLIFRAISLDGSGLNPSDAAAAALSDNLSVDANVELAGAIGYTGIVLLFMRDGAYCIDLSGAVVDPAVLRLLQANLSTAASMELFAALELPFLFTIIDADGAVAINFDGDAPGQVVILLLAEQLSDAAFEELNAAIAGGN